MKGSKLEYQVSQTSDIDVIELKRLILLNLESKKYSVVGIGDNSIVFDGKPGRQNFRKLGEGKIKISPSNTGYVVELRYYDDISLPLGFFIIALIFGVGVKVYWYPVIFALALSTQEYIRIRIWKKVAEQLLDDLLK